MVSMVCLLICKNLTTECRSVFNNTTLADCMATWLASFIDTPTSAWVRAGASLMPSPIITVLPFLVDIYHCQLFIGQFLAMHLSNAYCFGNFHATALFITA